MPATRFAASLAIAMLVGTAVAAIVGTLLFGPGIGFWGLVDGSVAGLITFGVLLARSSHGVALRRVGAALLCLVLGFAAYVSFFFVFAWGAVPIWSLEGMWMWPTAIGFGVGTLLALRWLVRIRPRVR